MKKLENNMTKIEEKVKAVNRQMETLENFVTETEEKVEETKKQIKTLENDMTKTGGKIKGVETNMKTLQNALFKTKEKLDGKDEEIKNINNYIACFLLAKVVHAIFSVYMYTLLKLTGIYKATGPGHRIDVHRLSFDTISENLKGKGLKTGLLIVSFHPSSQQFHHGALNAVSELMKTSPVKVLVQSSEDLMDIEPHKLVIIFVDFNDRKIILENEETEVGDLRNQTTKLFKFLGCDVFVVYCKDKGSQDLPPNNLYNPRLQSIERHPVLSELKRKNRVLSINDKFHPHQVELLKQSCQQL
uniref:Uncharacterized protein LOC111126884 n=1 Tax=Crassostrea virginica TaxID=6565 RepID=A0A8B8DHZ3_CRAVI|nr:uncharacterized protein LOC111126884 [Crassostrea virginica]